MFNEPSNWDYTETGGGVLPKGNYKVCITNAAIEQTQWGETQVSTEFTVLDGDYANRKYFKNFRFAHQDPKISQKAYEHWVNLCHNAGVKISPNNPEAMKQKIMNIELDVFKTSEGKEINFISKYLDHEARQKSGATTTNQQQQTNAQQTNNQQGSPMGGSSEIPF